MLEIYNFLLYKKYKQCKKYTKKVWNPNQNKTKSKKSKPSCHSCHSCHTSTRNPYIRNLNRNVTTLTTPTTRVNNLQKQTHLLQQIDHHTTLIFLPNQ